MSSVLTIEEFNPGNIIWYRRHPHVVNGVHADEVEVHALDGVELFSRPLHRLAGLPLIYGYGDLVPERLLKRNGFEVISKTNIYKQLPGNHTLRIYRNYFTERWELSAGKQLFTAQYVHDFQNIYQSLTQTNLIV